jgi:hypothetical protein
LLVSGDIIRIEETTMIIDDKRIATIVDGKITESFFSVKQENLAHIFSILRNSLYSDKAGAIIREYCTNAYDAHVDAGISQTPIQIGCPSPLNTTLTIRDFGKGLSEEQIFNIYASYGESTKRETNDQVGMMGLGSKSAFSYSDSFTIISYNGGLQKNYLAYIDDTGIGKVMKVEEQPSDETGIEIQVPVKRFECYQFENAIVDQLQFFDPKPIINAKWVQQNLDSKKFDIQISGEGYNIIKSNQQNYVVMGNVKYPFDASKFESNPLYKDAISSILEYNHRLVLFAEIGDVIPSASRESLDMREKTVNFIGESILKVANNIKDNIVAELDICPTIWDAVCKFTSLNSKYQKMISGYMKEGYAIDSGYVGLPEDAEFSLHRLTSDNKLETLSQVYASNQTRIFISAKSHSYLSIKKKIMQYGYVRNSYAVICKDDNSYQEIINYPYLSGAEFVNLDSIILPKIVRDRNSKSDTHDAYRYTGSRWHSTARENWERAKVNLKNGEGIYAPVSFYQIPGVNLYSFNVMVENLKSLGHNINIIGIRESDLNKLGAGWIHYRTFVQDILDNMPYYTKQYVSEAYIKSHITTETMQLYDTFAHLDNDPFNFKQIIDLDTINNPDYETFRYIENLIRLGFKYSFTKEHEIVNQLNTIRNKYPLLEFVKVDNVSLPHIKEYIEAMNR